MSVPPPVSRWTPFAKVHAVLLLLITIGGVAHHLALLWWFIEDSAITFSFARNLANGEGLVAFLGGERVEGYSNPTWTFLLAFFYLIGLTDLFEVARYLQVLIAIATIPVVYLAGREAFGPRSHAPLVAAGFVAASSQHAIFGGCGLENGLLGLLLALGLWRTQVEFRTGRWPWSALIWCLVAMTRPEGILYSAIAGGSFALWTLTATRSLAPTLKWLVTFWVPFLGYNAVRYWYFAWPFPNTYYAKLDHKEPQAWAWDKRSWKWSRSFFEELGQAFFLPIWVLGVLGDGRWRTPLAAGAFLVLGLLLQLAGDQRWLLVVGVGFLWMVFWLGLKATEESPPRWLIGTGTLVALGLIGGSELLRTRGFVPNEIWAPDWIRSVPPVALPAMALLFPVLGIGARGWQMRTLSWLMCVATIFFAVYAQGDWMKGYRWYATAAVPGGLLFAAGAESAARLVQEMASDVRDRLTAPGLAVLVALVLLQVPANVKHTVKITDSPDTAPRHVKTRVDFVETVIDRLQLEDRLIDMDVDMGAHLWWSDFEMLDFAGLVDVPFAHQKFERAFVREYVFQQKKPQYAHLHGGWATNTRIPTHPEWRSDYLEIPGFPASGNQFHIGNYVRRDAIVEPSWPHGDEGRVLLEGGIVVHGVVVPSAPATGRKVYVEVGVSHTDPRKRKGDDDFRMVLVASDGEHLATWDLAPGYDWLWPHQWTATDVFRGRYTLDLPDTLPPGTYDLGLVVIGHDGVVVAPVTGEDASVGPAARIGGQDGVPARVAAGELQWPGALEIRSVEDRAADCEADFRAAQSQARDGSCAEAEHSWFLSRKHRAGEKDWERQNRDGMNRMLADCWARSADDAPDRDEKVRRLSRARVLDYWSDEYRARIGPVADELQAEGRAALDAEDWETAYRLLEQAIDVDRTRSWARRWAEEARAHRLGIDPESKAKLASDQEARKAEAEERRKEAEERRKAAADARPDDEGDGPAAPPEEE